MNKGIKIMIKIVAEVIGIIGIICSIMSFQCEQRKRVMLFQVMASFMFTTQLFPGGRRDGRVHGFDKFRQKSVFFRLTGIGRSRNGGLCFSWRF